jgi:hypothetical protein
MSINCSSWFFSRFPAAIWWPLMPSRALAQRWGLYICSSLQGVRYNTILSENLCFTLLLTWASEHLQVHNPLPFTRTGRSSRNAPDQGRLWSQVRSVYTLNCNLFKIFLSLNIDLIIVLAFIFSLTCEIVSPVSSNHLVLLPSYWYT